MNEVSDVRQVEGELPRRLFWGPDMQLLVWQRPTGAVARFQLSYDADAGDRLLEWEEGAGLRHHAVDAGEDRGGRYKGTPLLRPVEDAPDLALVRRRFQAARDGVDPEIAEFVAARLAGAER